VTDSAEILQPLRTWSHLAGNRRKPSEYEVVSVKLHYHTDNPDSPWELDPGLFMNNWYRQYCGGSPLCHPDWDSFRDPDQLVYRTWVARQDDQETYVSAMLDEHDEIGHDANLDSSWVAALARWYTPSRYPAHLLQMASAYVGQMAPASTITTPCYFQAADQLRVVQHTAYRTRELANRFDNVGFATGERHRWEHDEIWQGFRRLLEQLLVTWDWAEAFVALNLVVKPAHDEVVIHQLGAVAEANGDRVLRYLGDSHLNDSARSRRWSGALVELAASEPGNLEVLQGWVAKWLPQAEAAVAAYTADLPGGPGADVLADVVDWHRTLDLA
jgi:toluene monooxygenase system protein E